MISGNLYDAAGRLPMIATQYTRSLRWIMPAVRLVCKSRHETSGKISMASAYHWS